MTTSELKKAAMAFELKDGTIIWISDEDIKNISEKIVLNGILDKKVFLSINKDDNVTKAQQLQEILNKEKGMPPDLRIQYYEEILRLYKTSGTSFTEEQINLP